MIYSGTLNKKEWKSFRLYLLDGHKHRKYRLKLVHFDSFVFRLPEYIISFVGIGVYNFKTNVTVKVEN